MKTLKTLAAILVAALITSCSSSTSSSPQDPGPALAGYCPTCYFTANTAVKGTTKYSSDFEGKTYLFDSQKSKDLFETNPAKYVPQYEGYCAYGVSFGKKVAVDPTVFSVVDDKLYLNKNAGIGRTFSKDPNKYITKANSQWSQIQ